MKRFQFKLDKLPIIVTKENDNIFVVESPVLDIATQGKSLEEAKKRFEEYVQVFFEEVIEMGTLDQVLASLGWVEKKQEWNPPVLIESSYQKLKSPVALNYA